MPDDVNAMSAELARDPDSLVYVELGEALRVRGQRQHATQVVLHGLERHPDSLEGHDLYARILVDEGDFDRARDVWGRVLESDPQHQGANKGLGFLRYRDGDLDGALDHLEAALAADPADPSVVRALRMVRDAVAEVEAEADLESAPGEAVFAGLEGADRGLLLVDDRGRVLGGGVRGAGDRDVSEEAAAFLAGAVQEAGRTARMLGLGTWRWMIGEGPSRNVYVTPPAAEALLLIVRDRSVPAGRLAHLAERAVAIARDWLEDERL